MINRYDEAERQMQAQQDWDDEMTAWAVADHVMIDWMASQR